MAKKKKASKTSRSHTLGAAYRAASTGVILASPGLTAANAGGGAVTVETVVDAYRADPKGLGLGLLFHGIDQVAGQRLFHHNTALGRGSLTAILPEAYAAFDAAMEANRGGAGWGTAQFSRTKAAFAPGGGFGVGPSTKTYLVTKYGGGLVRKILAMPGAQPIVRPVKKILSGLGVTV